MQKNIIPNEAEDANKNEVENSQIATTGMTRVIKEQHYTAKAAADTTIAVTAKLVINTAMHAMDADTLGNLHSTL